MTVGDDHNHHVAVYSDNPDCADRWCAEHEHWHVDTENRGGGVTPPASKCLAELDALLDTVFPADQCDDNFRLYGLNWLPGSAHHHKIAPPTPLGVERQAGDGPTQPSPATQLLAALKRIAMRRAWKTVKR
jgi:hypothetical protein